MTKIDVVFSRKKQKRSTIGPKYLSPVPRAVPNNALGFISFCILVALISGQANPVCKICGDGFEVGNPDAIWSGPSQPPVPCGGLESAGLEGRVTEDACATIQGKIFGTCECKPAESPDVSPTDAPEAPTADPTQEPVSDLTASPVAPSNLSASPVTSPNPTVTSPNPTASPVAQPDPTESPVATQDPTPAPEAPTDSTTKPNATTDPSSEPSVDPVVSPQQQVTNAPALNPSDSGMELPVIIGAAVGGAVLLAIIMFVMLRKRKPAPYGDGKYVFASSKKDNDIERANANIMLEPQDDMIILGDPMPGVFILQQDDVSTLGEPMTDSALDRDDTATRSGTSVDYDFQKSFAQQGHQYSRDSFSQEATPNALWTGISDGLSMEETVYMDEQHFEISAPPGKLGMVIDTPMGGTPVIHAIRSTSSLANTGIQVGDRLVAIDGIDTTSLTAMQVSKLIGQNASNPTRILQFVRLRNVDDTE